ncbi:hypothetical protein INR77_08780 [Erythrobacter sp. SCSIO 43205]|uniref:hypothetical protein n=1 Tax=Erythrobacter sp. SCSIO 43205 TaxID=2779361 RepID=UPI001CA93C09|nr:hypothetical protein [Erythrobacter sp. SCSIO 43205]UAB76941.1 hypothetical protein INR77_08780 [Erythrobacter sp. SCSIO 43205]
MTRQTFLTKSLALASALVCANSCASRDADVNFLPPAPPSLSEQQANLKAPTLPDDIATSEAAYESYVSDRFDYGDTGVALAYRWCQLWNNFASEPTDCGEKPDLIE